MLLATVTTGIPVAGVSLAGVSLSPGFRRLAFAQVQILWRDVRGGLRYAGFRSVASAGDTTLRWVIDHWWLTVPLIELAAVLLAAALCARYLWPLLVRLEHDQPAPAEPLSRRDRQPATGRSVRGDEGLHVHATGNRAPVPVELDRGLLPVPGQQSMGGGAGHPRSPAWIVSCRGRPERFRQVDARAPASPDACHRRSARCAGPAIPASGCRAAPR